MVPPGPLRQEVETSKVYHKLTDNTGYGVFAKEDIPLESVLIRIFQPLVSAIDTRRLEDTCYECLRSKDRAETGERLEDSAGRAQSLNACSKCKVVKYCSTECQKASWSKHHREECKIFAAQHPRVLPTSVRAIVRLLIHLRLKRFAEAEWSHFVTLESHIDEFKAEGGERWENLNLMALAVVHYTPTALTQAEVLMLLCKLMVNGFTLVNCTFDPIGIAMSPIPAQLNHSCDCNAVVRFDRNDGCDLTVVPLRSIRKDEQIFISYIDNTVPTTDRQKELRERYFFDCTCAKCLRGPTVDNLVNNIDLTQSDKLQAAYNRALELMKMADTDTTFHSSVMKYRHGLFVLHQTKIWPLHRYPFPQLRQKLLVRCLEDKRLGRALGLAAVQHFRINDMLMPEPHHPIRMVETYVFYRLIDYYLSPRTNQWPAQKEEFHACEPDFPYWRSYLLKELQMVTGRVAPSGFSREISRRLVEDLGYTNEEKRVAREKLDAWIDRVLADEALWIPKLEDFEKREALELAKRA